MTRDEIEGLLLREVQKAQAFFDAARTNSTDVLNDVHSGIPSGDGALRVKLAVREKDFARRDLQKALSRFNGFVISGVVPEDLQRAASTD